MPGLGATGDSKFSLSYGWHYSRATDDYYRNRINSTINRNWEPSIRQNIMDVSARYAFTDRFSLSATLPIINNEASFLQPPQGPKALDARVNLRTNDIGDMTFFAQRLMLNPKKYLFGNFALGLGMKVPTGSWDLTKVFFNETRTDLSRRALYPPSIMPGDGGTGIIFGVSGFKSFRSVPALRGHTFFASATYLSNPRNTNGTQSMISSMGVPLAPQFQSELVNSVTDSWNVAAGASLKLPGTWDKPRLKGLRARIVYEWQGIPRHDLFGRSDGFRQPGYTMAIAPGFTYAYKHSMWIAEVPITFQAYIDPGATAIPAPAVQTPNGPVPAAFTSARNFGIIAPAAVAIRYVRTF